MKSTHNISTNIVRDEDKEINFIVTPNTKEIFKRIFLTNNGANKSFTLIGNYGTGKSTFLWAIEKALNKEKLFFDEVLSQENGYAFLKLVGDNISFSSALKTKLKLKEDESNTSILLKLESLRLKALKSNKGLIIIVDEFGKFLEFANKNESLQDLYLIQQISEWANDDSKLSYFILSLHQNFVNYGRNLSPVDRVEWEKVKGRFIDLLFNEPVEQLIYFASKSLEEFSISENFTSRFKLLNQLIKTTKLTTYTEENEYLNISLFPLDWLSANVLVNALQRYGQNERSLFSFLNDNTKYSIRQTAEEFYTVAKVFDYLVYNLTTEINSSDNPHRPQWQSTFRALDRAELFFDTDFKTVSEVIKTIGLVNIFGKAGGLFDKDFIINYFKLTKDIDIEGIVEDLEKTGITRFYKYSNKINFLEGTDIDLEQELITVSKEINPNFSITEEILALVTLPFLTVKEYTFEVGTPRFFEFRALKSKDDVQIAQGSLDGYVNLFFDQVDTKEILKLSKKDSNVFVVYNNSKDIRNEVFTIKKFDLLIEKYSTDRNALKLLEEERLYHIQNLEQIVLKNLFEEENNLWIYNGVIKQIKSKGQLYKMLTQICSSLYNKTPIFINELMNKEILSTPINAARKALFRRILEHETKENLNFDISKFPPEKAIYLTLLKNSHIHKYDNSLNYYTLSTPPKESNFFELWIDSQTFLDSAKSNKRNLKELYEMFSQAPYKLKKGFVDFWVPIFLIARREDFALFHETGGFIPYITEEIIDLIHRNPENFAVKSYDVTGLKVHLLESYKELVQVDKTNGTKESFLAIFGNFLRFQRGLNVYTLKTHNLSKNAINLRDAIIKAKDPEDALFTQFPTALGYHSISYNENENVLESYTAQVQDAIREIRVAYDELLNRIEAIIRTAFLCNSTDFEEYKVEVVKKLSGIYPAVLAHKQNIFYKRLISPLNDRISWLKSVADVALGKSIDQMIDEEEKIVMENIKDLALGLLKANEVQTFNHENPEHKMYYFRMFTESGEILDNKVITVNETNAAFQKTRENVLKTLQMLDTAARKELLLNVLSEELNTN